MSLSQYATPYLVDGSSSATPLNQLDISTGGSDSQYDENWLQTLMFNHPQCLPISEIDRSFLPIIPVCRELSCGSGYIDNLYATPDGKLVVLEAKLWRNPQARREVIGQILDYAKALSQWRYEDLQREVSRQTGIKGNALYELVKAAAPDTHEPEFVDEVSRSLKAGKFMLLIAGDGIREGVASIAQFMDRAGTLNFTFGLVEMAIYQGPDDTLLVQPRVLAKTTLIPRVILQFEDGSLREAEVDDTVEPGDDTALQERRAFFKQFWDEFLAMLVFDDPSQEPPNPAKGPNCYFYPLPDKGKGWGSVYLSTSRSRAGVYFTFPKGDFADEAYQALLNDQQAINQEIDLGRLVWDSKDGRHSITYEFPYTDLTDTAARIALQEQLADYANRFVNALKPRLEAFDQQYTTHS